MEQTARLFAVGEGRIQQLGRLTITFTTTAQDTAGAYSVCEILALPSGGAGLHRHETYHESVFVIEGHCEFQLGDEKRVLGPGDSAFLPPGLPHAFKCLGPEPSRQIWICSPGGVFDGFVDDLVAAQKAADPVDFGKICARHGIEVLTTA